MALTRSAIKHHKQGGVKEAHHQHADPPGVKVLHWRDLHDPATGRIACRPAGAPAGVWPHTPWWHCMLHDPYERLNCWSHALPGLLLLLLAPFAAAGLAPGGAALALFCACAATTHLCSAATHVYPDSHALEKVDHVGIVATIVGTPLTALMAKEHGHVPTPMLGVTAALVVAAFLPPAPRVAGFVGLGGVAFALYWRQLASALLAVQIVLYLAGAAAFLRNGGHGRYRGLADHNLLHYAVTAATALHVWHLLRTVRGADAGA